MIASSRLMPFRHRNLTCFQFRWISACVFWQQIGLVMCSIAALQSTLLAGNFREGDDSQPAGGGVVVVNFYSPFHSLADVLAETLQLPFPCQCNDKKSGKFCVRWVLDTLKFACLGGLGLDSNKTVMDFWFWSTSINSCFCTLIYGSWTFITWRKSSHMEVINEFFPPKKGIQPKLCRWDSNRGRHHPTKWQKNGYKLGWDQYSIIDLQLEYISKQHDVI